MLKKILLGLAVVFILIQFIRPDKNDSNDRTYDITTKYTIPADVEQIMKVSCNDCHTNNTEYPWYSNVQPVAWWLDDHIKEGKRHLNFSEFTKKPLHTQNHKLEEVIEMVENKEMPMEEYTYLGMHPEANLTEEERIKIMDWAKNQMNYLSETYPADSLVRPKRN